MTEKGHTASHTHTQWHTPHILFTVAADPVYSVLLCLCVHMKERKKKHFYWTSLSVSLSWRLEERGEIKGERSDGLWWWRLTPREKVKDKVSPSSLPPPPFSTYCLLPNPASALFTLCFEADCKLHVLISPVTVAYFNRRRVATSTSSCPFSLLLSASVPPYVTSMTTLICHIYVICMSIYRAAAAALDKETQRAARVKGYHYAGANLSWVDPSYIATTTSGLWEKLQNII